MPPQFLTESSRWHALTTRAPSAHAAFIYAVTTTRIFCRPTCPSRLARRANVLFFDTPREAAHAGFRACKRCRPAAGEQFPALAERQRETVRRACEMMRAAAPGYLSPAEVAERVGWSARYFHGVFKRDVGVTPAEFARRCGGRKGGDGTLAATMTATGSTVGSTVGSTGGVAGSVGGERVGSSLVIGKMPPPVGGDGLVGLVDGVGEVVGAMDGDLVAEPCVMPDGLDTLLDPLLFGEWQDTDLCYPPLDGLEGVSLEGLQDWSPLWDEGYGTGGHISPADISSDLPGLDQSAFVEIEDMFNV